LDTALIDNIDILVIDNDVAKSAETTIAHLIEEGHNSFNLHYHNYPIKGLVNVRNELIRRALEYCPDFLAFIDDDEFASTDWLNELIKTLVTNHANLAVGPVRPVFEKEVSNSIAHWFTQKSHPNQCNVEFIQTGNMIVRAQFLLDNPMMRFDQRFNTTGAEDSYFGVMALKMGVKIWWAQNAKAYETIPEKRATISWLLKRNYRGAITYTFIILLEKQYLNILKKIFVNCLYLALGITTLILTPIKFRYRYYGPMKIAESIGGFAGLFNVKYHEYAKGR
jgi:succinoglycan biosynthesis protein ExoM